MITALPQPTDKPKLPNRYIWVGSVSRLMQEDRWDTGLATAQPMALSSGVQYLLPGDDLAAALAELDRAIEEFEKAYEAGYVITRLHDLVSRWLEARRAVRELTPKGTNP